MRDDAFESDDGTVLCIHLCLRGIPAHYSFSMAPKRANTGTHIGGNLLGILLGQDIDDRAAIQPFKQGGQLLRQRLRICALDLGGSRHGETAIFVRPPQTYSGNAATTFLRQHAALQAAVAQD